MNIKIIRLWIGEWITLEDVTVDDITCIYNEYHGKYKLGIKDEL